MSFRLFIYYCALIGGWSGLLGWALGWPKSMVPAAMEIPTMVNAMSRSGVRGLYLGLAVALGLGLVDAIWNVSLRRPGAVMVRVAIGFLVGAVGGMIGGVVGAFLYFKLQQAHVLILGWTLTGLLVGLSISVFELLNGFVQKKDLGSARKKMIKCLLGGLAGGAVGGVLAVTVRGFWDAQQAEQLWSPTAFGFTALGMCIGLFVGLAQVMLKEAWIKVEAGFRPGREMLLSKEKTTIGRAESCDIGLFGDANIEKLHASILHNGPRFVLEDAGSSAGTFVNEQPVRGQVVLRAGDLIRIGKSVLRFGERQSSTRKK